MNSKEFIAKLERAISELGGNSEFMQYYGLNQEDIEASFNHPNYPRTREDLAPDQALVDALGSFKQVLRERCGSDMDVMRYVYHFSDHGIFLAMDAYYSSWDSPSFDNDWYEVRPVEVTKTEYHPL